MRKQRAKKIFRVVLFVGTFISLLYVPWPILWAWVLPLSDTVQEEVQDATEHGFAGVIVYVDEGGKEPAYYAAGWHNREMKIEANPQALFKIASISKLYTVVAVTKLVHAGQLSLDKTLADYMPELVGRIENADKITLRMMVQHRSGIPNYTDTENFYNIQLNSFEEKLELILDMPANFEPGTDYEYCNTNYLLLRKIMDETLGYPYFEYIRAEILKPLNLNNTFAGLDEVNIEDVMSGYNVGYEPDLKTDNRGMLATAEDVGNFIRALNDGSVFEEGEGEIYSSIYKYGHTGLVPGYQSIAHYHADIDAVVVQFTSTTDFLGYNWGVSEVVYGRIMKILRREV